MNEDDLWKLHDLLAKDGVDDETLSLLSDDIQAGEFVVGIEQIADTVSEYDIVISERTGRLLRRIGEHFTVTRPSFIEVSDRFSGPPSTSR
ncbi:hypothetical protein GCM10023201_47300 [Actinomycetospora corticicola]|uniref:Uncharacterized protein n=1 Tax=Actinomycetospora corticicola TaxID=663602 RepID=A0A7Y9E249_9PSEU|nr:hypothetical protein [Actinomycetospora corticicola]NYD39560.1 hypothetical protein [Actinomycetospora corticicola]